jgi:hypothetical protein
MKKVQKVINWIFRYEMGVSLKNSGFSYLYGSISYLFGYENFGCFFLMPTPHTTPFFLPPKDPSQVLLRPNSIPE